MFSKLRGVSSRRIKKEDIPKPKSPTRKTLLAMAALNCRKLIILSWLKSFKSLQRFIMSMIRKKDVEMRRQVEEGRRRKRLQMKAELELGWEAKRRSNLENQVMDVESYSQPQDDNLSS